jgi:hypothetical protein
MRAGLSTKTRIRSTVTIVRGQIPEGLFESKKAAFSPIFPHAVPRHVVERGGFQYG